MIITELESTPLEPVTLDEVKDYLGYAPDVKNYDDVLTRHITASRQILERNLDIYITQRSVRFSPGPGPVPLPVPFVAVRSAKAKDRDGNDVDLDYEVTGDSQFRRTLHWKLPEGCTDPTFTVVVGYEQCPEDIRSAIVDLVKGRYDREPIAPLLEDAMMTLSAYRRFSV